MKVQLLFIYLCLNGLISNIMVIECIQKYKIDLQVING